MEFSDRNSTPKQNSVYDRDGKELPEQNEEFRHVAYVGQALQRQCNHDGVIEGERRDHFFPQLLTPNCISLLVEGLKNYLLRVNEPSNFILAERGGSQRVQNRNHSELMFKMVISISFLTIKRITTRRGGVVVEGSLSGRYYL